MNEIKQIALGEPNAQLLLEFQLHGDRWQHRVVYRSSGPGTNDETCIETTTLLTSIEGNDTDVWPASPPLQELSSHELPSGSALLGVGMAGRSHWSGSYSLSESADDVELIFDLACAVKLPRAEATDSKPTLGSMYRVGTTPKEAESGQWTFLDKVRLTPIHDSQIESVNGQFQVRPIVQPVSNQTVRWGFSLKLVH